jgi:hypothetical protein
MWPRSLWFLWRKPPFDLWRSRVASDDGALEDALLDGDLFGVVGVEVLEALGEFVGAVEDVLDRSGHGGHVVNLALAGMA